MRVWAVAVGAVRLRFFRIGVGEPLGDLGLEFPADFLVVLQQWASEFLGPLAGGSQDEAGDGVQLVCDGAKSQPPGLEGDGTTAGGDVENYWIRATDVAC